MPRFIEVSHVIEPGMVTYPGLPVPEAVVFVDYETSRERYALAAAGSDDGIWDWDLVTRTAYLFYVRCDSCGKVWQEDMPPLEGPRRHR